MNALANVSVNTFRIFVKQRIKINKIMINYFQMWLNLKTASVSSDRKKFTTIYSSILQIRRWN